MTVIPPDIYDHYPKMEVIEQVTDFRSVDTTCQKLGLAEFQGYYNGCAFVKNGKCYIWRIADRQVQRHEYAHCNGWHHNPVSTPWRR